MQKVCDTGHNLFLLAVQLSEVSNISHLPYARCPLIAKAKPRWRRHQRLTAEGRAALCGAPLRLLCIQKQSQMVPTAWTVQENKLIKIHRHQSVRKHLLDCWRTVSEARMIWREEIPYQILYNNMVNAVLTDTEPGKHQVSLQGLFYFFLPS